MYTSKLSW